MSEWWEPFLDYVAEAYRILRRARGMITFFVTQMFSQQKDLRKKRKQEAQINRCLSGAFYDAMTEEDAVQHVRDICSKGEASPKKAIKDLVHKIESSR